MQAVLKKGLKMAMFFDEIIKISFFFVQLVIFFTLRLLDMNFHSPCCSQSCLIYKERPLSFACSPAFVVQSLSYSFKKQYGHVCHSSSPLPGTDFYIHYFSIAIIKYIVQGNLYTKRIYLDFCLQKTESLMGKKHDSNE